MQLCVISKARPHAGDVALPCGDEDLRKIAATHHHLLIDGPVVLRTSHDLSIDAVFPQGLSNLRFDFLLQCFDIDVGAGFT